MEANLVKALSVIMVTLISTLAGATYTDYIGAGHATGVTVTTCSSDTSQSRGVKTVDGSGLSGPSGTHDTTYSNHWLSRNGGTGSNPNPARSSYGYWIRYDFGEVYNLSDMWLWNYNEAGWTGRGARTVIIDYSTNGSAWTELTTVQFPQASGAGTYAGAAGPSFNGNAARYVLLTIVDGWGIENYFGLAEVKFNIGTGSTKAILPTPANGATAASINADLKWVPAAGATSHKVYFGTNPTPAAGELKATQAATTYDPGALAYGTTYYWRIDEIIGGNTITGDVWSFTTASNVTSFSAIGCTSVNGAPTPMYKSLPPPEAAVDVTFDLLPTKMRFVMPSFVSLVSENNKYYFSGYFETYDPLRVPPEVGDPNISWEAAADEQVRYNRMWIQSQNNARIMVKFVAPMKINHDYDLFAHTDTYTGSPWGGHCQLPSGVSVGYGDWTEETYYIYPDGVHTRYTICYTAYAQESGMLAFGFDRNPPNYVYECMEGSVFVDAGLTASDILSTSATLTLIRMDGTSTNIPYLPTYPETFGTFADANIMMVGLNSTYKPFVIGIPTTNVELQPYYQCDGCNEFIEWPIEPTGAGAITPLSHMICWDFYERTSNTVGQLFLQGMTNAANPSQTLPQLAGSWLYPAAMTINGSNYTGGAYEPKERAYKVTKVSSGDFVCTLAGSSANPIVNPAIVINGWGTGGAGLKINGVPYTGDYRVGNEGNNLVVWINYSATASTGITITPPDTTPPTPNPATWAFPPAAVNGTTISMTATTGSDPSTPVQYYFHETTGHAGATDSGWQTSPSYSDTGLSPSTLYTYTVQMRDWVQNTGAASSPASATTQAADTTPPTPNPATWATPPAAISDTAISMTATTASDPSTPVQYYFDETSGHAGGTDSGWQTSSSYTDTGLSAGTLYTYTVQMRDAIPNTGTASSPASATTQSPDTLPPTPNPATWASVPAAISDSAISMTATTGSDLNGPVQYFFDETSGNPGGTDSGWQTSSSYTDTGLSAGTQYTYRIQMRDALLNTGTASTPASATTQGGGWTQITYDDFEGGFGNWVDGGTDCLLYAGGSTFAHQGANALNLQDNTSTSWASTNNLALGAYNEIKVDFWYKCNSMDSSSEDFWLQISTNGGSSYTTVEEWNLNDEFVNGTFYSASVTITGYALNSTTRLRFLCDASADDDDVYIDEIRVSARAVTGVFTDYVGASHITGVTVTQSSVDDTATGIKTVNGSGLVGSNHDTVWDNGWLSTTTATNPNPARPTSHWIKYDFGYQYKLGLLHGWNSNETGVTTRGLQSVTIDYSQNGTTWTTLGTYTFPQAPGASYAGFDGPNFGAITARYVLITANSNYGDAGWWGLAELKFNLVP